MRNNIFIRVDDRLLHGQVVVSWIPFLKCKEIIIMDDEYARDEFMCELIKSSGPENIIIHVKTINETIAYLNTAPDENTLLLIKDIQSIRKLSKNVKIDYVNIGGIGASKGRKRYYESIHLSNEELNILKDLASDGISVEVKILPKDKAKNIW